MDRPFEGFDARHHELGDARIFARTGGRADRPPILMLHGFPQTHAMWHRVARVLAQHYRVVLPDLRGYGDSFKPRGDSEHANYSKRTMATDMAALMRSLGHESFLLVGHDRGGRVAHRLALDHPSRVRTMCLLDIAPTVDMYDATDLAFARNYHHWFHLIQPAPLPERMIGGDPRFYLHWTLGGWGTMGLGYIEPWALAEYERCFCNEAAVHAACEDYRAAAHIDLDHDRASRASGRLIACNLHLLWGSRGVIHQLFDPIALWQAQCSTQVTGETLATGHFLAEEDPEGTTRALLAWAALDGT